MDSLEAATWALVVATALLVLASAIPILYAEFDRRARKRLLAAQLVPEIYMLKSALIWAQEFMLRPDLDDTDVEYFSDFEADGPITQVNELMALAPQAGILFTNELTICLHLVTQAQIEVTRARRTGENEGEREVRRRLGAVQRAGRLYRAARMSLDAAEAQLPEWSRRLDSKTFHDRFVSLAEAREAEAEKATCR